MKKSKVLSMMLFISMLTSSINVLAQNNDIVEFQTSAQQILIKFNAGYTNISMTIKGPNELYVNEFLGQASEAIVVDDISALSDGLYRYEFSGTTTNNTRASHSRVTYKSTLNNGRNATNTRSLRSATEPAYQSGHFRVRGGAVIIDANEDIADAGDAQ